MTGRVHIVGAGLAGLACAVRLASDGRAVTLHEAAGHAGGRCRSYRDPILGREINNGNHLILSGNRSMLAYLAECGASDEIVGPAEAVFPFADVATGERWAIRPNSGPLPWWLGASSRRAPDGGAFAHLTGLMRLRGARPDDSVAALLAGNPLYSRFWRPLTVAILNTPAEEASATLLWHAMEESLALGASACRPLFARHNLGRTFVEPALAKLQQSGAEIRYNDRLRSITRKDDGAALLQIGAAELTLGSDDWLVLATTPEVTARLLPDVPTLSKPWKQNPILNAHFAIGEAVELPGGQPFLGVTGGEWTEWIFRHGEVISVTLSAALAQATESAETAAAATWREVQAVLGMKDRDMPTYRIVKEQRATIAQTPEQAGRRPAPTAVGGNILLAGDWTDTGLPCTIEGAIRSGHNAASLILA